MQRSLYEMDIENERNEAVREGHELGRQQGLKEGRHEGHEQGLKEGREQGLSLIHIYGFVLIKFTSDDVFVTKSATSLPY